MKKPNGLNTALLIPGAEGWQLHLGEGLTRAVATLDEAADAAPAGARLHLALPCRAAFMERMKLPSTDAAELADMVQLQLERSMPYPVEELTSEFELINSTDSETTLLTAAAHHDQLDTLCQPLRKKGRVPAQISVFARMVAASCGLNQTVLCLWPENGELAVAIAENQKLGFAQTLPGTDVELIENDLHPLLLSAELEGAPTNFSLIRLSADQVALRAPLEKLLGVPVELTDFSQSLAEPNGNLVPEPWVAEIRKNEGALALRSRLQLVAVVWLLALAGAFVFLAVKKKKVQSLDVEIAKLRPILKETVASKDNWAGIAAAVQPERYILDVARALRAARPGKELVFTLLEYRPDGFRLEGEAPTADLVIQFENKVKAEEGLKAFDITMQPPDVSKEPIRFKMNGTVKSE